ncbi:MAG: universal stress protein [Thiolinea sp.]
MFDKILVALDGSEGAHEALKTAVSMQKSCGGELLLLSVYRDHNLWKASITFVDDSRTASTDEAMQQYARNVAEQSKQFVQAQGVDKVRAFYMGGGPARTIIRFSQEHAVDLIVLGSRGLSAPRSELLGGVSHKVANLAKCPVMVV